MILGALIGAAVGLVVVLIQQQQKKKKNQQNSDILDKQ